ncbi:MAG: M13 family metallopeptidase [Lachnospiraceae bacterium]|nr:M13 family metallopeptidase [Lachnospiraceae bacterium]
MKRKSIAAILLTLLLIPGCGEVTAEKTAEETVAAETAAEEESFDPESIKPGDDYNGYINAKYLLDADLEKYKGRYGSFDVIAEKVDDRVDEIIEDIAKGNRDSYAPGSNEQLIYDVYQQVLEASTGGSFMNAEDIENMLATVDEIYSTSTIDEFLKVSGKLFAGWGVNPICGIDIDTDMRDSSSGSISLRPFSSPVGGSLKDICIGGQMGQSAAAQVKDVLTDLGMDIDEANERSIADVKLIIDIALSSDLELIESMGKDWSTALQTAKYKTNEELDKLCPNVGTDGILRSLGIEERLTKGVYLWDEGQLAAIDSLLTEKHLKEWQDIAVVCYKYSMTEYLSEEYGGTQVLYSNDKYAKDVVKYVLGREIGEEYVKRWYDSETVEEVTEITKAIVEEYKLMIKDCSWLSDKGKTAIRQKLDNMMYFIGAGDPHTIDPKDAGLIGHSVYETRYRLNMKKYEEQIEMLSSGVERNGFKMMNPQTVNACYSPDMNSINITLAIMDAPFYSKDQSYWQNLGGIGAVVGHEISHAFDNHGMMFDMNGNYSPDWIPEKDRKAFDEMAEHIEEYYSDMKILDIHPVDGELTLGENLADISGVDCILRLTKNNEQRKELFENYARIWAAITPKDEVLSQLYADVHSPDIIRVNAVVSLFDPFYEIYDVKPGDAMYVAPEDRVKRW